MTSPYDPANPLAGAVVCPHCEGVAKTSRHAQLVQICNLCGAPRVELGARQAALSGNEIAPLKAARQAQRGRAGWRFGGFMAGVASAFGIALTVMVQLLASPGLWWSALGTALTLPFLVVTLVAFSKARKHDSALKAGLDESWESAAVDLLRSAPTGMTAQELGGMLPISPRQLEKLTTRLAADPRFSSQITDDGQIALRAHTSLRIDPAVSPIGPTMVADSLEERFAALEERLEQENEQAATAHTVANTPPKTH